MSRSKSEFGKETVKVDWSNAQIATIQADPLLEISTNDKAIAERINELAKRHSLKNPADLLRYLVDNCCEDVVSGRGRVTELIHLDMEPETIEVREDISPEVQDRLEAFRDKQKLQTDDEAVTWLLNFYEAQPWRPVNIKPARTTVRQQQGDSS